MSGGGGGGEGGGGGGEGLVKSTFSLASHLNQRADLVQRIFSFHKTRNPKEYINLRSSSKLFHRALHQPPPLWTSFPHSNHPTLQSLVNRLEELRDDEESSGNVPSVLFIEEGEYGGGGTLPPFQSRYYINVKKPLSIYGAGRGKTTLVGVGLRIQGNYKSEGIVEIEELTIKGGEVDGLCALNGMNVIMRGCTVEECQRYGVLANSGIISCDDLQVVGCGESGVIATNSATITLSGQGTSIQRNVTRGNIYHYGLYTDSSSDHIHLVHPLTKEEISTNNGGGGNWFSRVGTSNIKQVSKK